MGWVAVVMASYTRERLCEAYEQWEGWLPLLPSCNVKGGSLST